MSLPAFSRLRVSTEAGVTRVVIGNPPVNILDAGLAAELVGLLDALRDDADVRVIVFESADDEFFIAHVDMSLIDEPTAFDELTQSLPSAANPFQAMALRLRAQPQATIVKLAGKARGGGAESVAAADMSFAALETAGLGQIEALMGIIPGGAGTQLLAERTTRGRALEIVLGADLIDAATAERYGWINRALPAADLDAFVDRLARNIAALPDGVIAAAKSALPPARGSHKAGRRMTSTLVSGGLRSRTARGAGWAPRAPGITPPARSVGASIHQTAVSGDWC